MNILEKAKSPKISNPALNQTVDESVEVLDKESPVESDEKNVKVGSVKVEEESKQESGSDQYSDEDNVLQTEVDVNEKPFMGNINGSQANESPAPVNEVPSPAPQNRRYRQLNNDDSEEEVETRISNESDNYQRSN